MKTTSKFILSSAALVFCFSLQPAAADTIANWTFESLALSTANTNATPDGLLQNVSPEIGNGTASEVHASAATDYTIRNGNGSANSLNANHWSVGDYYEFVIATTGFQDIVLSYDQTGSSTGPADFQLSYSVNGANFMVFDPAYTVSQVSWSSKSSTGSSAISFDLSSETLVNNQPLVYFHIADVSGNSLGGGTVGATGSDRIDNFMVSATAAPEPAILSLAIIGGLAGLLAVRRKR